MILNLIAKTYLEAPGGFVSSDDEQKWSQQSVILCNLLLKIHKLTTLKGNNSNKCAVHTQLHNHAHNRGININ